MPFRSIGPCIAARLVLLVCCALAGAAPISARDFFAPDNPFLTFDEPILQGEARFRARIDAVRKEREPVGLVLSGGSARALAHVGALIALEERGIRADFVVANSMGSIVAILYAAGIAPGDMRRLFEALPVAELFDPAFPTAGGFLDAGRFSDELRSILAFRDIEDFPIPLLLVCEDIRSRRKALISEGEAAAVAAASFALPVIFNPIEWRGMRLIDGGVSNLVPTGTAKAYADRIIVSTSVYSREMNLRNPLVVLNRTLDLVKTREAVTELKRYRPALIRCDVEDVSYMAFDRVSEIIDAGYRSAVGAMDAVAEAAAPIAGTPPGAELARARELHTERVTRAIAARARGIDPPRSEPRLAWLPAVRLFDPAGGFGDASRGRSSAGLGVRLESGYWSLGTEAFLRWDGGAKAGADGSKRAGNAGAALDVAWKPFGRAELRARAETAVRTGDLAEGTGARTVLLEASARADLHPRPGLALVPRAAAEALVYLGPEPDALVPPAIAETSLSIRGGAPGDSASFLIGAGVFAEDDDELGPCWIAAAELPLMGPFGLKARAKGRFSAVGEGSAYRSSDGYRGGGGGESGFGSEDAIFGPARLRLVANGELAADLPFLRLDLAETLAVRKAAVALFLDAAAAVEDGTIERRLAAGISGELSVSAFGLLPVDLSVHASGDIESGDWSVGIFSGFLFRGEEGR